MTETELPKKIKNPLPPTVINTRSGRYAIFSHVGWFPVSADVTFEDVLKHWEEPIKVTKVEDKSKDWSWQVPNSKNTGFYTVSFDKRGWQCTCTGFSYRRDCKHVQQAKAKVN